mmetsp:Transcript_19026/g.41926  ORF Transcript_19026/g.41926 Transcript_19026/m.41926 type:complete len:233 (-) Transcript_19026:15-713(-)
MFRRTCWKPEDLHSNEWIQTLLHDVFHHRQNLKQLFLRDLLLVEPHVSVTPKFGSVTYSYADCIRGDGQDVDVIRFAKGNGICPGVFPVVILSADLVISKIVVNFVLQILIVCLMHGHDAHGVDHTIPVFFTFFLAAREQEVHKLPDLQHAILVVITLFHEGLDGLIIPICEFLDDCCDFLFTQHAILVRISCQEDLLHPFSTSIDRHHRSQSDHTRSQLSGTGNELKSADA